MKKTYIIPTLESMRVQVQQVMALSLRNETADGSDALSRDNEWGDIWDSSDAED